MAALPDADVAGVGAAHLVPAPRAGAVVVGGARPVADVLLARVANRAVLRVAAGACDGVSCKDSFRSWLRKTNVI